MPIPANVARRGGAVRALPRSASSRPRGCPPAGAAASRCTGDDRCPFGRKTVRGRALRGRPAGDSLLCLPAAQPESPDGHARMREPPPAYGFLPLPLFGALGAFPPRQALLSTAGSFDASPLSVSFPNSPVSAPVV